MKRLLQVVVTVLSISYPFLIYWGLQHFDARLLLLFLVGLLLIRCLNNNRNDRYIAIGSLFGLLIISLIWDLSISLKFYPVAINLGFLLIFATSLISPPTVIERFARIQNPDLDVNAVSYTRKVTWIWCWFFVFNGTIAAITAIWASEEIWVLYNGFIAYIFIALLFAGEWLVRRRVAGL